VNPISEESDNPKADREKAMVLTFNDLIQFKFILTFFGNRTTNNDFPSTEHNTITIILVEIVISKSEAKQPISYC
jgi:hypothetical protein